MGFEKFSIPVTEKLKKIIFILNHSFLKIYTYISIQRINIKNDQ